MRQGQKNTPRKNSRRVFCGVGGGLFLHRGGGPVVAVPGEQALLGLVGEHLFDVAEVEVVVAGLHRLVQADREGHPGVLGDLDAGARQRLEGDGVLGQEPYSITSSSMPAPGTAMTALPVRRMFSPEVEPIPMAKASMGGLKAANMTNETGAIFSWPFSFSVQTNTSGLGEVRAGAWPIPISFMGKTCLPKFHFGGGPPPADTFIIPILERFARGSEQQPGDPPEQLLEQAGGQGEGPVQ